MKNYIQYKLKFFENNKNIFMEDNFSNDIIWKENIYYTIFLSNSNFKYKKLINVFLVVIDI